jgi:hypothetical protein
MIGDGYTTVFHCMNAEWEQFSYCEPDAAPVFCALVHVSVWKAKAASPEVGTSGLLIAKGNNPLACQGI